MEEHHDDASRPVARPLWRLAQNFSLYGVAAIVSLACSLLTLVVYATALAPAEFGLVAAAQVLSTVAITVVRLGIGIGMFRYLAESLAVADRDDADSGITTCLAATTTAALVPTLASVVAVAALKDRLGPELTLIAALIALNLLVAIPRETAEIVYRASHQAGRYVLLTSSFLVLSTVGTVILVGPARRGAPGVFLAVLIANAVTGAAALFALLPHVAPKRFSMTHLLDQLRFGLPSVPALLADSVTQYSDRFFLIRFAGLAPAGVYSLGYRIGLTEQQVLGVAAQTAWDPFVLATYRGPGAAQLLGRVTTYFTAAGMGFALLISTTAPLILDLAHAQAAYSRAVDVVFLVAIANLFALMQHMFGAPTTIRLRPSIALAVRLAAGALNVVLNLLLIPRFGMMGAAWATVLTYAAAMVAIERIGRRLWPIAHDHWKIALILVGGIGIQLLLAVTTPTSRLSEVAQPPIAIAAFALWLFAARVAVPADAADLFRRFFHRQASLG